MWHFRHLTDLFGFELFKHVSLIYSVPIVNLSTFPIIKVKAKYLDFNLYYYGKLITIISF